MSESYWTSDEWKQLCSLRDEYERAIAESSKLRADLAAARAIADSAEQMMLKALDAQIAWEDAAMSARAAAHAWKRAAKFWYFAQPDDGGEWERWQEYRYRRELFKSAEMCGECGKYPADYPSGICAGCEAYHDHLA